MRVSTSLSLRRRITGLVWILGLVLALMAIARRPSTQVRALAWAAPVFLSAPEGATFLELEVALHELVAAGDVVGRFDPAPLAARNQVLQAELEALSESESSDRHGRSRLFERDREAAGLELAELSARVGEGEARLRALGERLVIDERLVAEGVAPPERASDGRREIEVVRTRLEADRSRLSLAQRSAVQAGSRAAAIPGPSRWQRVAAERRLAELDDRLERLTLRSSTAGQITEVYRSPGEWLEAGERVLRITPATASEVHAWLDARAAPEIGVGTPAEVRRANGESLTGTVVSVGGERLRIPRELWLRFDAPEWGYRIRIETFDGALAPGEPVQVSLVAAD